MNYNDYYQQVNNDAIDVIDEQFDSGYWDADTQWDDAYDHLFNDDAVTGNGSGSYTFNAAKALENVKDVIWDKNIRRILNDMGITSDRIVDYIENDNTEELDVIIRCFMLVEVYSDIEKHFSDRKSELEEE